MEDEITTIGPHQVDLIISVSGHWELCCVSLDICWKRAKGATTEERRAWALRKVRKALIKRVRKDIDAINAIEDVV